MRKMMLAALAATTLFGNAGSASAAIKDLGDCYNTVIAACNKKSSDAAVNACANNGMDQCDKQFGNAAQTAIPAATLAVMKATARKQLNTGRMR